MTRHDDDGNNILTFMSKNLMCSQVNNEFFCANNDHISPTTALSNFTP